MGKLKLGCDVKTSSVSVTLTRNVVRYAAVRGVEDRVLCTAAGIAPALLSCPDEKISGEQSRRLWDEAVRLTGDANFGLHLGLLSRPTNLGLVGFAMLSAPDFGSALERLIRYTNLLTDGVHGRLFRERGFACFEIAPTSGMRNFLLETPRQQIECSMASIVTVAEALTNRRLPVSGVTFRHPAPSELSEHRRVFRGEVRFGAKHNRLRFDAEALAWPLVDANPQLLGVFDLRAGEALRESEGEVTWSEKTRRTVVELLTGASPGLDQAAARLGVGARQLQRLLAAEGSSYRQVLDSARGELARAHLERGDLSLGEISYLLGFGEPSAFHRAFKRWTGSTPRRLRQSAPPSDVDAGGGG